ncbi:MAG TPA: arginase family protein, partial [Phycisphaerae bacterium]|nr:arginase family protein [Phycisphaerae bacterium]
MSDAGLAPPNFLGLSAAAAAYESAHIVVLPVPFEATTSYGTGTRGGPDAILIASRQVETFDPESQKDLADAPIHTAAPVA